MPGTASVPLTVVPFPVVGVSPVPYDWVSSVTRLDWPVTELDGSVLITGLDGPVGGLDWLITGFDGSVTGLGPASSWPAGVASVLPAGVI